MNRAGAFLLAPVPASIIGAAVSWASRGWPRPDSLFVFYLLALYAAQLLFGIAIRAALLRSGLRSAASFAVGGIVMIALPTVPYVLWAVSEHPDQRASAPIVLALWLLMGGITGLTAWFLARPTAPPPPGK